VRSCGLSVAGTTSVAPGYPQHEIGDLLVLIVEVRDSTVSPTTPANWTSLGSFTGGSGVFGIDTGSAKIQAWTRHASSTVGVLTGTLSVTLTSGNTAVGIICSVHRDGLPDNATAWSVDVDGGSDNTAGTGWSVTGSGIDFTSNDGGDAVIVGSGINTDLYTFSAHALSASGITFQDVFEDNRMLTANGNDSGLNVSHGYVTGGSATGVAPTFTMTSSGTATDNPAGASIILAIHGNPSSDTARNVRLISTTIKLSEGRFWIR
jgi:MSHA biogenesis protein MshQ